jgi:hypothetical protein
MRPLRAEELSRHRSASSRTLDPRAQAPFTGFMQADPALPRIGQKREFAQLEPIDVSAVSIGGRAGSR